MISPDADADADAQVLAAAAAVIAGELDRLLAIAEGPDWRRRQTDAEG